MTLSYFMKLYHGPAVLHCEMLAVAFLKWV